MMQMHVHSMYVYQSIVPGTFGPALFSYAKPYSAKEQVCKNRDQMKL